MKTCFRLFVLLSMILGLCTVTPSQTAGAQVISSEGQPAMPASLQDAFLAASVKPFSTQRGTYTTEYNGVDFKLNVEGLKAEGNGIRWGIALRGMGRGNQAEDVSAPEIVQTDGRLEYRRGALTEWYRDTALGVEQGFTISESPKGNGKLVLHLDLYTDLEGKLNDDERGVSFAGANEQTLRYDHLKAYDANGAELDAKMVYNPAQVVIHIDDGSAAYPITIDPLIYLEQKVIALDGTGNDYFGTSVALSGDTALVGAYGGKVGANAFQGSAYVFVRSGMTWTQQAKLTASDGATNDYFGRRVALMGDTALVGAYGDDVGANTDQGAAYVFTRSGTAWTQQAKLTASDGAAGDDFGYSVALAGDTALVGAHGHTVNINGAQGAAYVFTRSGTAWTQQAQLTAGDGAANDAFGWSVALSGDTALVGAFRDTFGTNSFQGSAYIFTRSGTAWSQQAQLTAADGAYMSNFGYSVALTGDTALVGAEGHTVNINGAQGSAYVFTRSGTTWTQQAQLTAADGAHSDWFGYSVALSGDTALVGAGGDDIGENSNQGSAYIFTRSGTAWSQQQKLAAADGATRDQFGAAVALTGDIALVGAVNGDVGANTDQGSAYFYTPYNTDADLMVNQTVSDITPDANQAITYTIMVTNLGPDPASGVAVRDLLPDGVTYASSISTFGLYDPLGGVWSLTSLPVGVGATLTINATVNSGTAGQSIVNTASLAGLDANLANNSASASMAVNAPQMGFSPNPVVFEPTLLNTTSAFQTIRVTNTGTATLQIPAFGVEVTSEFSINYDSCSFANLPPGSGCWVFVQFTPTAVSARGGTLTVYESSMPTNTPHELSLAGTGAVSQLVVSPTSLNFGDMAIGGSSLPQTVTVSNTSNFPATLSLVMSGPFIMSNSTCSPTLAANSSCYYTVQFAAVKPGIATGQMLLTNSSPISPLAVNLTGNGVRVSLGVTPSAKNYGSVLAGKTSAQVFTITNTGVVEVDINSLSITGTNPAEFVLASNCTSPTLAPAASCTATVTFMPNYSANFSAILEISSSAPNSPTWVSLSGRGIREVTFNGGLNTYSGTSKIPTYWDATNFSATDGKDTIATNRKEGTASVKISNTTAVTKKLTQNVEFSGGAGDPFIFSYWVKGSALPTIGLCQAQVLFYSGSTLKGTKTLPCGSTGTFAYTQKTLSFTAPAAYTSVKIVFTYYKASGTVWFDLVSLLK